MTPDMNQWEGRKATVTTAVYIIILNQGPRGRKEGYSNNCCMLNQGKEGYSNYCYIYYYTEPRAQGKEGRLQ